jgi:hypothetical protein
VLHCWHVRAAIINKDNLDIATTVRPAVSARELVGKALAVRYGGRKRWGWL